MSTRTTRRGRRRRSRGREEEDDAGKDDNEDADEDEDDGGRDGDGDRDESGRPVVLMGGSLRGSIVRLQGSCLLFLFAYDSIIGHRGARCSRGVSYT